jgi:hypothetical protein
MCRANEYLVLPRCITPGVMLGTVLLSGWMPWGEDEPTDETEADDEMAGDDPSNIEDEDTIEDLSKRELKKRAFKQEQKLDKLQEQIDDHKQNYKQLLEKGANAGPGRRRAYAIRAKLEKFKAQFIKLERLKTTKNLSVLTFAEGKQELDAMGTDQAEDDLMEAVDLDPENLVDQFDEMKRDLKVEMEEVGDALNSFDVRPGELSMEAMEEEEIMEKMNQNEMSSEEVVIDDPMDVETDSTTTEETTAESPEDLFDDVEDDFSL